MVSEQRRASCDFVVATGRFQLPIHIGHLEYLRAAKRHAMNAKAPFHILTGPRDDQLPPGELTFVERRAVISAMAETDQKQVHNQFGSPHGTRSMAEIWAKNFFAELFDLTATSNSPRVDLVIVRKKEDIKQYKGQSNAVHYSSLLVRSLQVVELRLIDVTEQMTQLSLSSSALRSRDQSFHTPTVSVAAKLLKEAKVPAAEWSKYLLRVRQEFRDTVVQWDDTVVRSSLKMILFGSGDVVTP